MPAGVRVQQLTPVVRGSSTQPTTIVRLMSPATTTVRPGGTGQQQIIQLNTNKQQQPLVIKAITAQTSNRQQQPILLAANTQQKPITSQTQQQVLVLNQNTFSTTSGQQPKFTLQMTNIDHSNSTTTTNVDNGQQESTTDNRIPQLDGSVDDQVKIFYHKKKIIFFILLTFFSHYKMVHQVNIRRRKNNQDRYKYFYFRFTTIKNIKWSTTNNIIRK
jgi:hypothetical protein